MSTTLQERKKVTTLTLRRKKQEGQVISMMTAYDYPSGQIVDQAGMDVILVGDSLGMTVLGYETTLPVTMEDMIHHCKAVARGAQKALLVGDMPFMSYQVSVPEAVRNAGRFLQEAGMDAVKLEGGRERVDAVKAITGAGIPVMGHLGLTPQSIHQLGGFRAQATLADSARILIEDAMLMEEAGCFSIVLESIPSRLAEYVSRELVIPTIGIGAGAGCDGQVLVLNDVLGYFDRFRPRFVKTYANLREVILQAMDAYIQEVGSRSFPAKEHTTEMTDEEWEKLLKIQGE
jgi:3-methyl-2-oxobutanoate hydroxymethyltransferase